MFKLKMSKNTSRLNMELIFLLLLFPVVSAQSDRVISVVPSSSDDIDFLSTLLGSPEANDVEFLSSPSINKPAIIQIAGAAYETVQEKLHERGQSFTVLLEDLQKFMEESEAQIPDHFNNKTSHCLSYYQRHGVVNPPCHCDHLTEYCAFEQIEVMIHKLADAFPERVRIDVIGRSYEERPIYAVKIVEDVTAEAKDAIWVEVGTHCREWLAVAAGLNLINQLARNNNGEAALMMSMYDWYIVPVHNPDGYVYTHTGPGMDREVHLWELWDFEKKSDKNELSYKLRVRLLQRFRRMWRKNRQPCGDGSRLVGSDLNRNWDVNFGGRGSSSNCASSNYRGLHAFSAPETRALRDAVLGTDNVLAFFAVHTTGQMIILPLGYTETKPDNYQDLYDVAKIMTDEIYRVDGQTFTLGTSYDFGGVISGSTRDWMYHQGVPWPYLFELRPVRCRCFEGFDPDPAIIPVSGLELFRALWAFANADPGWP